MSPLQTQSCFRLHIMQLHMKYSLNSVCWSILHMEPQSSFHPHRQDERDRERMEVMAARMWAGYYHHHHPAPTAEQLAAFDYRRENRDNLNRTLKYKSVIMELESAKL